MKTKYINLILISILALVCSCKKVLTEDPVSLATADGYYSTTKGIEDGLKAAYTPLRSFYAQAEGYFMTTPGTDMWTNGFGGVANNPYFNDYSANLLGTDAMITTVWNQFYIGINQCNTVVDRAPRVSGLSDQTEARIMAEARFLRALYYFHLVQQFGDVHFTLQQTIGVQTVANRTPVADIYKNGIIPDLLFAAANLPAKAENYGRATKPAAEALLARVQLTVGDWQAAETLAKKVISDYDFKLVVPFKELWDIQKDVNTEVIWSVQFTDNPLTNGQGNQAHMFFNINVADNLAIDGSIEYGRGFRRFMPTNYLIKLFNTSIDSRWEGTFKTVWLANVKGVINGQTVNVGDTAIKMVTFPVADKTQTTVPYSYFDFNDKWVGTAGNLELGGMARRWYPALWKFDDPLRASITTSEGRRDFPVIRLAEIYLIAAEAAIKLNRPADAASYINIIRKRAALPGKESQMVVGAGLMNIDFILDERGRELAGEMHRWYDLKRTNTLLERTRKYNLDAAVNIKEMHLIRPIPQTQIDRVSNPGEFKQNPGY